MLAGLFSERQFFQKHESCKFKAILLILFGRFRRFVFFSKQVDLLLFVCVFVSLFVLFSSLLGNLTISSTPSENVPSDMCVQ